MSPPPVTLTFDLESGVRVAFDVGYLCANFSLPRPLFSMYTTDRQSDVRRASSLNASALWGRGIIIITSFVEIQIGAGVLHHWRG